jgi:hypothetical protein
MTTIAIRLRTQSQQEAEQASQHLAQQLGPALRLAPPRAGRGAHVWFVYGTLQIEALSTHAEMERSFRQISRLIDRFASEVQHERKQRAGE